MIRHVLLDADGVMQQRPGGWVAALAPFLGDRAAQFLDEVGVDEQPCLRGVGDFRQVLAGHLERYDVSSPAAAVYAAVWLDVHVEEPSRALVRDLRDVGLGVHLATNQEAGRATYLKAELGHDQLFDESFYSCDLGVAKPGTAFFTCVLDRLCVAAPEVLFVDDHEPHVVAAREVGLAAERWHLDDGIARLRALLERHGIDLGSPLRDRPRHTTVAP